VKLHDLKPAAGSRRAKRRVGRGIAAGQGKTAGRGTKGQKARAGGTIPAWFEGGQTPLHQRIPKLRGFRNLFKVEYEVVNVGDIARVAESGGFESAETPGSKTRKGAPATVNQEILRSAGLIRRLDRPMKVLGGGELSTALFVVADAFSASARSKIEAAGGTVSVLETPELKRPALGVEATPAPAPRVSEAAASEEPEADAPAAEAEAGPTSEAAAEEPVTDAAAAETAAAEPAAAEAPKRGRTAKARAAAADDSPAAEAVADDADAAPRPRARKPRTARPDTDA
jgi:large subunit ribosomal protein L15